MRAVISISRDFRERQRFLVRACLSVSLFLVVHPCNSQSSTPSTVNGPSDAIDSAPSTPKVSPPLTEREEEMLRLIQSLQHRVARLEAERTTESKDVSLDTEVEAKKASASVLAASVVAVQPTRSDIASSSGEAANSPTEAAGTSLGGRTGGGQGERKFWSPYTPNLGFKIANTEYGDVSLSIYTYARYLNQRAIEPTYTNAFGVTSNLQQRQDFQLNKLQIKFLGWMMSPKFRYFLYAWTSNATQGQGAQVVLAGNLNYSFNKYLTVGAGIFSLPGARSVEGNFPFWLSVDSRLIADEFFRPSYSSGIKASGTIAKGLTYQAMVANNRSTLGVSAAQLPNHFNTISSVLVWMPKGDYGLGWGDFEHHESPVTRFGFHFNHSDENKQSQPNSDSFENVQLRLSDGSVIFTPNLFGPGITITDARYKMASFDAGIKYRGYALEGEYYWQWLNDFRGANTSGLPTDYAYGYQLQASAMVVPKTLQIYAGGSEIIGQFGRPWDFRAGTNYFPFKNKVVRWNTEFLYLYRSPVGYTSVPFPLGGTGPIFHTTLELAF
jgi:hypothetical protein